MHVPLGCVLEGVCDGTVRKCREQGMKCELGGGGGGGEALQYDEGRASRTNEDLLSTIAFCMLAPPLFPSTRMPGSTNAKRHNTHRRRRRRACAPRGSRLRRWVPCHCVPRVPCHCLWMLDAVSQFVGAVSQFFICRVTVCVDAVPQFVGAVFYSARVLFCMCEYRVTVREYRVPIRGAPSSYIRLTDGQVFSP